jgi:hypothetical protein
MGFSVLQPGNWRLGQDACRRLQVVLLDYFGLSRMPVRPGAPTATLAAPRSSLTHGAN